MVDRCTEWWYSFLKSSGAILLPDIFLGNEEINMNNGKQNKKEDSSKVHNTQHNEFHESRKTLVPELIRKARGEDRSMNAYAADAGVSRAALSQIVNGVYTPSPEVIAKLTSEEASPRNGVTYEELMTAAGYYAQNQETPQDFLIVADEKKFLVEGKKANVSDSRALFYQNIREFENTVTDCVCSSLLLNGFTVKKVTKEYPIFNGLRQMRCDLMVELKGSKISRWLFEYRYFDAQKMDPARNTFLNLISGKSTLMNLDEKSKVTYVINSNDMYQYIRRYEHAVGIRGEVSVALYSSEEKKIVDEFYLSNYKIGDKTKEIFLAKTTEA